MSQDSIQTILKGISKLESKLDMHIQKSDTTHEETNKLLSEIKPYVENLKTVKKVGGFLGWFFNTKVGFLILVALLGWFGVTITNK